jgi:hypothetical protein
VWIYTQSNITSIMYTMFVETYVPDIHTRKNLTTCQQDVFATGL